MTAEEMFEKLGYIRTGYCKETKYVVYKTKNKEEEIEFCENNVSIIDNDEMLAEWTEINRSYDFIKAVYKQIEELGW